MAAKKYTVRVGGTISIKMLDGRMLNGKVIKVVVVGLFLQRGKAPEFVPFDAVESMEMIS